MKWLINKAVLLPSVEQLLSHQIDSWTSKTIIGILLKGDSWIPFKINFQYALLVTDMKSFFEK